jgi:probable rRNA maturation factor
MHIDLVNDTDVFIDLEGLNAIFGWFIEDNIFLCTDTCCLKISGCNEIKEYNAKYRGENAITDVLTFPCDIQDVPFKGDIIININAAEKQRGNDSLEMEIARLFIHGLLHLAGMDHLSAKQKDEMRTHEDRYINRLNN